MKRFFPSLAGIFLASLVSSQGMTATFTVTPSSDNDCSDLNCDLQAALTAAGANGQDDTLNIQSGNYNISGNSAGANTPFAYNPALTENFALSLVGNGATPPVLEGNPSANNQIMNLVTALITTDTNANLTVQGLVFQNGHSPSIGLNGGGLNAFTTNASIQVDNCVFSNNSSDNYEGGASLEAASAGNVTLTNSVFSGNSSVKGIGGGATFSSTGNLIVTGNTFQGNTTAGSDGGLDADTSSGNLTVSDNLFVLNKADPSVGFNGAAEIDVGSGVLTVANNIVLNNSAGANFGGLKVLSNAPFNVVNNTISGNSTGGNGGGLYLDLSVDAAVGNVSNNIVWGNTAAGSGGDIFADDFGAVGTPLNLLNNDFTSFACSGPCVNVANPASNIDLDPQFADLANGDVSLVAGSPCIDKGTAAAPGLPSLDFNGNPRIIGSAPDMGAIESLPDFSVSPTSHDFGKVAVHQSSSTVITLSNNGANVLNVTGMTLSDSTEYSLNFDGGNNPCGSATPVLDPGSSCTIEVIFNPQILGDFPGNLTITSDDPEHASQVVTLTGSGSSLTLSGSGCSLDVSSSGPLSAESLCFLAGPLALVFLRRTRRQG